MLRSPRWRIPLLRAASSRSLCLSSPVLVHGLKQKDGKFVARIYGIKDNPKEGVLFGKPLSEFLERNGIREDEVWKDSGRTLWTADIYPACDSITEAVKSALNIYAMANGGGNAEEWRSAVRKSLCSGFNDADPNAIIAWDKRMQELVRMDGIAKLIIAGRPATEARSVLKASKLTPIQENWLKNRLENADFNEKLRLYYYIGVALGGREGEKLLSKCFKTISSTILKSTLDKLTYNNSCKIVTDKHTVKLPLRVNWGGGWSDTPPYCNERGGTVLNASILLNGDLTLSSHLWCVITSLITRKLKAVSLNQTSLLSISRILRGN